MSVVSSTGKGPLTRLFFLTPAPEKTKTQGTNSSQKLKKKTQALGSNVSLFQKLKKKLLFEIFLWRD